MGGGGGGGGPHPLSTQSHSRLIAFFFFNNIIIFMIIIIIMIIYIDTDAFKVYAMKRLNTGIKWSMQVPKVIHIKMPISKLFNARLAGVQSLLVNSPQRIN